MAFLPPLSALASASSALLEASLHCASSSFLSFSRSMARSCSALSSSASLAASTIARAAFSSESFEIHGKILFSSEFVSKSGGINHSACSLLLRELGLSRHLVKVGVKLSPFVVKLPLGSGDGLVGVGEVSQSLVGVREFLLGEAALPVSSLQEGTAFLQGIPHGGSLPVSGHLAVSSLRLQGRLLVNLGLGVSHLGSVLLDSGSGLKVASNGVLQSQTQLSNITLKLLLHS